MRECPTCRRIYPESNRFCTDDGTKLVETLQSTGDLDDAKERKIPQPPEPLPMRLSIVDAGDEGHRSRVIQGLALDVGHQGMRIQTGTIETGQLNIIRDHTIAFKNLLDCELDLPSGSSVRFTGYAAWYRPAGDGLNWMVGIYIRDMLSGDRSEYDRYLSELEGGRSKEQAPAGSGA